VPERTKGLTPRRVVFLAPPASLRRFGVDPISRISPYRSEMIVRLGLIKIARIVIGSWASVLTVGFSISLDETATTNCSKA
jgi:hypothetical protein